MATIADSSCPACANRLPPGSVVCSECVELVFDDETDVSSDVPAASVPRSARTAALILSLPVQILSLILAKLSFPVRFRLAWRVCHQFRLAAAAATPELRVSTTAHASGFQRYLRSFGQHVTSLSLRFQTLEMLPCANLQRLDLSHCTLLLGPDAGRDGMFAGCSRLTWLSIDHCDISDQCLTLAAVPQLKHLTLKLMDIDLPSSLLLQAPQLTALQLRPYEAPLWQDSLLQLSSLTDLRVLEVDAVASDERITVPGLSQLTALTSVLLSYCCVEPASMQHLSQMVSFDLKDVTLISRDRVAACTSLLSCIASMSHLQYLQLSMGGLQWVDDLTSYTALTVSSSLQRLAVDCFAMPASLWQAMLPAGRTWTRLSEARVTTTTSEGDLIRLVSSCPELQTCTLWLAADQTMMPFKQLTALRHLRLFDVTLHSLWSLSALTQLASLGVNIIPPGSTWRGCTAALLALTALQGLTTLHLWQYNPSGSIEALRTTLATQDGGTPDVWQQLKHWLSN